MRRPVPTKVLLSRAGGPVALAALLFVTGCASAAQGSPPPSEPAGEAASATPTATPSPTASPTERTGDVTLDGPSRVAAGSEFDVDWTGPDNQGDYVAIVPAGAEAWASGDPYFYTARGTPGTLVAPILPGPYVLWYVDGTDDSITARVAITVTEFEGDLLAAESVPAGEEFEVVWNGPNASGDYVTIVPEGAEAWSSGDPYFYTTVGSPGSLIAPIEAGDYELWYVPGSETGPTARRDITVEPVEITLEAPARVGRGETFEVDWTGPDGPTDYITIVPADSPPGTYLSWRYTSAGTPLTLTAPDEPGAYEIWYASDRVDGILESIPIIVD